MRIVCLIASMQSGGAERVMSLVANHWVGQGHLVTLMTFERPGAESFYPLDPRVDYRPLALARVSRHAVDAVRSSFLRIRSLRRAFATVRTEVVVSFCTEMNVLALLAARGMPVQVVVSERVDPASHQLGRVWCWGRYIMYPFATQIVFQTAAARDHFPAWIRRVSRIIPNPIASLAVSREVAREPRILAVGRLDWQKGFDLLLEAFARVSSAHPRWKLRIVGEGPQRRELKARAIRLGLQDRVEFPGLVKDVAREYAEASIFVLSSRYEGFPNVLCEAMSLGLPVVGFDCPGGVREILQEGDAGMLVRPGRSDELAAKLASLMEDARLRQELGEAAMRAMQRFAPELILRQWDSLLGGRIRTA